MQNLTKWAKWLGAGAIIMASAAGCSGSDNDADDGVSPAIQSPVMEKQDDKTTGSGVIGNATGAAGNVATAAGNQVKGAGNVASNATRATGNTARTGAAATGNAARRTGNAVR